MPKPIDGQRPCDGPQVDRAFAALGSVGPALDRFACHDRNGTRNCNALTSESAGAEQDDLVEALWRPA
jgi:hypothetical protein